MFVAKRCNISLYNTQTGYEQFGKMRSDPALCFKALCGEEPVSVRKKKKGKQQQETKLTSTLGGKVGGSGDGGGGESEASDSEEEEESEGEMESGPSTPASHATPTGKRYM